MPSVTEGSRDSDSFGEIIAPKIYYASTKMITRGEFSFDLVQDETKWDKKTLDTFYQIYKDQKNGVDRIPYRSQGKFVDAIKTVNPRSWEQAPYIVKFSDQEIDYFEDREINENIDEVPPTEDNIMPERPEEKLPVEFNPDRLEDKDTIPVRFNRRGNTGMKTNEFYEAKFPFKKVEVTKDNIKSLYRLSDPIFPKPIYKNFDGNFDKTIHENCIVSILCKVYTNLGKSSISANSIKKWFETDTSIQTTENFLQKYQIGYRFYNLCGNQISKFKPAKKNRPDFNAIFHAGHVYRYTAPGKPKFEKIDNNPNDPNKIELPEVNSQTFNFNPNFLYRAESNIICKALMYETDAAITPTTYKIDMKRAYYQCLFHLYNKEEIGVFTPENLIEKCQLDDISQIKPHYEYYLSEQVMKKIPYITTNKMLGRTVILLHKISILSLNDIVAHKRSTYTISSADVVEAYKKLKINDTNFKSFSILYGKTGTMQTGNNRVAVDIINEYDGDLVKLFSPENAIVDDRVNCERKAYVNYRTNPKFMHLNLRNIYDFIVDCCNCYILSTIYLLEAQGCTIHSVKTDAIQFDTHGLGPNPIQLSPKGTYDNITLFSPEPTKECKKIIFDRTYYDPHKITADTKSEMEKIALNVKFINAPAGKGKSYFVSHNLKFDHCMTLSNILASKLSADIGFNAVTLYKGLKLGDKSKANSFYNQTVWIDEFSLIPRYIWSVIFSIILAGTKFIITGDVNQGSPIREDTIQRSIIFEILQTAAIELPKNPNERNDDKTVELGRLVLSNDEEDQEQAMRIISSLAATKEQFLDIPFHLAFTNKYCNWLNNAILKHRNLSIDFEKRTMSPNIILVAKEENKIPKIIKGQRYLSCEGGYRLICDPNRLSQNPQLGEIKEIPWDIILSHFILGFCATASSSQGLTIDDKLCIHECRTLMNFDNKLLYTAITRVRGYHNLHTSLDKTTEETKDPFEAFKQKKTFKGAINSKIQTK